MSDFGAKIASLIVLSGLLPAGSASMGRPSLVWEANLPQLSGVGSYPMLARLAGFRFQAQVATDAGPDIQAQASGTLKKVPAIADAAGSARTRAYLAQPFSVA